MEGKELVLVKLGGSVITHKDEPLKSNAESINKLASALFLAKTPLIVIHGGGSFGHFYAKKYGISRTPSKISGEGVAKTRNAMLRLNSEVVTSLDNQGLNCYSIPPSVVLEGNRIGGSGFKVLQHLIDARITPVTFGDVLVSAEGFYIISGDRIIQILAADLRPKRVVFTLDVDGVYNSGDASGELLRRIRAEDISEISFSTKPLDVTGGMHGKLMEAIEISRKGIDVCFVNGMESKRVVKALIGEPFEGTIIEGAKNVKGDQ